jgi:GTP-binding protein SAR1
MSWLFSWVWDALAAWGIRTKKGKIVFLGLDNSGKTTLLHMLRDDKLVQHMPTQKPTMEELQMGGLMFQAFDLGGHEVARRLWREYSSATDGVVFLVDASDRDRFAECRIALDAIRNEDEALTTVPILVLGNKIDRPGAASADELRIALDIYTTARRPQELFMCSIVRRQGFKEGFEWLSQHLT